MYKVFINTRAYYDNAHSFSMQPIGGGFHFQAAGAEVEIPAD